MTPVGINRAIKQLREYGLLKSEPCGAPSGKENMSVEALTWARKIKAPSSGAKFLLIMLADYAGKKGESFYPLSEIADDCQISVDSVRRRLLELQSAGMIARVERRRADGSRSSDVTIVLVHDEARRFAESLGWNSEAARAEGDIAETPGIEPLADCDHPLANCDHPLAPAPGGGRTVATPIMKRQLNDTSSPPTPQGAESEIASLREEASAAEARWEALKRIWPFDAKASPGKARAAFFALAPEERELAINYAPRYIEAWKGNPKRHLGNWLADRDWTDYAERDAAVEAAKRETRDKLHELHDRQRAKYGGVLIRWGSPQNAAWARHDDALGVNWRRELRDYPIGQAYVRPTEWPPSSPRPAPPDQPEARGASP